MQKVYSVVNNKKYKQVKVKIMKCILHLITIVQLQYLYDARKVKANICFCKEMGVRSRKSTKRIPSAK